MPTIEVNQIDHCPFQRLSDLYNSVKIFSETGNGSTTRGIVVSEETLGEAELLIRRDLPPRRSKKLEELTAIVNFRDPQRKDLRVQVAAFSLVSDGRVTSLHVPSAGIVRFASDADQAGFCQRQAVVYQDGQDPGISEPLVNWFEDVIGNRRYTPLPELTIPKMARL